MPTSASEATQLANLRAARELASNNCIDRSLTVEIGSLRAFSCVARLAAKRAEASGAEREFFIDNLLVRIHFIIEMIWWTGLAPWEF